MANIVVMAVITIVALSVLLVWKAVKLWKLVVKNKTPSEAVNDGLKRVVSKRNEDFMVDSIVEQATRIASLSIKIRTDMDNNKRPRWTKKDVDELRSIGGRLLRIAYPLQTLSENKDVKQGEVVYYVNT